MSGSANTTSRAKETRATIGDADIQARDVAVEAAGRDDAYLVTVNASVAGAAGVGAAAGVGVIANRTEVGIRSGATLDASRDLRVAAVQESSLDLYTVSGAGGIAGVSGAFSIGVIDNTTRAFVEDGTAARHATLDAGGATEISARSGEEITTGTVSAAGGGVGVAGAVGIKVVGSEATAEIGDYAQINQTRRGALQDVRVAAEDNVELKGGAGAGAFGAYGAGATADVNVIRNTTTAAIGDETAIRADRDIEIAATSSKDLQSAAVAAAGGASAGIAGGVALAFVGASLESDSDAKAGIGNGATAAKADETMKADTVAGKLGNNEHAQGAKSQIASRSATLGVAGELNDTTTSSRDKTRATVGREAHLVAGDDVTLAATDKTRLDLLAAGAAGGFAGIGGAVGIGITKSTTEAFVDSGTTLDAGGDVEIAAHARNIDATGSKATSIAGAGGVVGASASVAVLDDAGTTRASLGSNSEVWQAATLTVAAQTQRKSRADAVGASAGTLAIGASVARANFAGTTASNLDYGVQVGRAGGGKTVSDVIVEANDASTAIAHATAGTAGVLAGSGAVATASVGGQVQAAIGEGSAVSATDEVRVGATATPSTEAESIGVNTGLGAAGASVATAETHATTRATLGSGVSVSATSFDLLASREAGAAPSALARAAGSAGGLLLGANATVAQAKSDGETTARVGNDSTLTVSGTATVKAQTDSQQTAAGLGLSIGLIAAGANVARAQSNHLTQAVLGDGVRLTGDALQLLATGEDANYAYGVAGSGGVASAPFSEASTANTSQTYARSGSGDASRKVDVTTLLVAADHTARFDSWLDNTNAALVGVSGARTTNSVDTRSEAQLGTGAYVQADNITLQAHNTVVKAAPATIPGLMATSGAPLAAPAWNINSSSGGLADQPAAGSTTTIATRALTQVGAGAHLEQTGSTSNPGTFALDAWNEVTATDKVKMSSGGATSSASAKSEILADTNDATVRVGDLARVMSLADMNLGARSVADLYSQAAVDVYGLVGVAPFGSSTARFQANNAIDIGAGSTLDAGRDIKLSAGASSGDAPNQIQTIARSDVYNNTAIPVNQAPVADAVIGTQNRIVVHTGADLGAARNIGLYAEKGTASASGVGIGKDIYREALSSVASAISNALGGEDVSFETRTGRAVKNQAASVEVNGTVHTGTQREQLLEIGPDGSATRRQGNIHIQDIGWRDVAADIQERIAALDKLISSYATSDTNSDAAIAVAAYESEKKFLQRKLYELGFTQGTVARSTLSALEVAQQTVAGMTTTISNYTATRNTLTNENTTLTTVTIPALEAQRANYEPGTPEYIDLTNQINAAQNTVNSNNTQIAQLTVDIDRVTAERDLIQTKIDNNQYSSTPAAGPMATFLTLSDATAQLGNIHVRGDRLHGSGTLDAPGDARITITNSGPNFLILRNLSIPPDEGGKVFFNGVDVKSNAEIDQVNGVAGGANFTVRTAETGSRPTILVESTYDPLDPGAITPPDRNKLAPDIVLQGDISNLRGLVKIDTAAGSIRLEQKRNPDGSLVTPAETASVRADEVQIATRNGDFVQSYTNTFVHTGGNPLAVETNPSTGLKSLARSAQGAGPGIVANGSVLIAARYLNINGVIQSGIPQWAVIVPVNATVNVPGIGANASFEQAKSYYESLTPAQKSVAGAEYFAVNGAQFSNWEKIAVRYNAKEDRLELSGVQVQGGYINLFGQIFNTNTAGGELRVLDGYGEILVNNQTSKPLWIASLDTGRGVQGRIDITNITGLNADGTPITTTTSFVRAPGAPRTGYSYLPASGLRYAMQVGKTTGQSNNYLVSNGALFGIAALPSNLADYWVSGQTFADLPIPNNGEFLGQLPGHSGEDHMVTQTNTSVSSPVVSATWFECNWWTLCIYGTYYTQFTVESSTREITTRSLKADNPIAVKFIGKDNGLVSVTSTGDLVVNGNINNRAGNTVLNSDGSITQNGERPIVGGGNVTLSAGTGIGESGQLLQVNVKDGGTLNATSASGDIHVRQMLGDLRIGSIGGAGVANVHLEAERNLLAKDESSFVQGRRVELVSDNGGIGEANSPLVVRTGYSTNQGEWPNYGLKAHARESINIKNTDDPASPFEYSGNLLLIAAESTGGDVRIETTGSVIDNNPHATTDTRTQEELAALWDSLRLRGALAQEKANEAVAAYQRGKETRYRLYWQMRQRQPDGGAAYDPGHAFAFTAAERAALLASGMSEAEIAALAASRTAQYHQLNAEVGSLTASYVADYRYTVSAEEEAAIRKGASWSDAQLALSVGAGLLKNVTDTVTTIKEPNARGRNVTLLAGTDIGSYDESQIIDLSAGLNVDDLTPAQKAALAAAERGDASLDENGIITIAQPRPVNVSVGNGALKADAAWGYALIGSEENLRIDQVSAMGDIRIKTAGSLVNAASVADAANVVGGQIILEAANGGIGSVPDASGAVSTPLRISQTTGASLIARAAGDVWIASDGDLRADTLFSRADMRLTAAGAILDSHDGESPVTPENNLLARNLFLTAQTGSIGTADNPLDVGTGRDGAVTALASTVGQGVFLNGPAGEYFNVGQVTSGDALSLTSAAAMKVDGRVTAPGPITLVSGGAMTLTPWADIHATTQGVYLRAGALAMQDADRMRASGEALDAKYASGEAARMLVDVGTIDIETAGDALITGIETGNGTESAIRVVSAAGRILDNGDTRLDIIADTPPAAKLTIHGALGIGNDPLDVRLLNLQASSGGVVDLAVEGPVNIVGIAAADRVLLTAGGDITGGSVISSGTGSHPDQSISITSSGGSVNLASVSGQSDVAVSGQAGVSLGTLTSTNGSVSASATGGDVTLGTVTAGTNASVSAVGDVSVATGSAGGSFVMASLGGNVDAGTVSANSVTLSASGHVGADMLNVVSAVQLAGDSVSAVINGGAGTVTGFVTGFAGGVASDVNLTLSGSGGFAFSNFWTGTANVDIPLGSLSIGNALIQDHALFTNPLTSLRVDQHNLGIQPFDVQLYSAGAPFYLSLIGNHVATDAFVIHRSPAHEVITPSGSNASAVEQGEDVLVSVARQPGFVRQSGEEEEGLLITYTGIPVSLEDECDPELNPDCRK
ncbi:MAG: hypothetical protein LDL44_02485 [Caenispirillum sp.]|nr:hypothetical protein [Caenispirillum sp.]